MFKKLAVIGIIISLGSTNANAAINVVDILKGYVLPCGLSLGTGLLLSKNEGVAIGVTACVGLSAATFFSTSKVDSKQLDEAVKLHVDEKSAAITEEVNGQLLKFSEAQKKQMEQVRDVLREVLAERLVKMEEELKAQLEKKMQDADFMPTLEKRIAEKIKEEVHSESKIRQKEIIDTCVDEVIKQVVAKPIAVPDRE